MRRGQGALWGNYYLHLMFQLPELDGTKSGFIFLEWKLVVDLCVFFFNSLEGILTGHSALLGYRHPSDYQIFFEGRSKTPPTITTHSFHHHTPSPHYVPLHWVKLKHPLKQFSLYFFFQTQKGIPDFCLFIDRGWKKKTFCVCVCLCVCMCSAHMFFSLLWLLTTWFLPCFYRKSHSSKILALGERLETGQRQIKTGKWRWFWVV